MMIECTRKTKNMQQTKTKQKNIILLVQNTKKRNKNINFSFFKKSTNYTAASSLLFVGEATGAPKYPLSSAPDPQMQHPNVAGLPASLFFITSSIIFATN